MKILSRIWTFLIKIWKDSVMSKVISAGIIFLIASVWSSFSTYPSQIYASLIVSLSYKVPIYVFLSLLGLYYLAMALWKFYGPSSDTLNSEEIGNYKFAELVKILSDTHFENHATASLERGYLMPTESVLESFLKYYTELNEGVLFSKNYQDGGFVHKFLCPKLHGYGLVEKKLFYNVRQSVNDTRYQITDLGRKFFSLIERSASKKSKARCHYLRKHF